MTTIIPPVISDYRYDGEREVALKIKQDPKTSDWIVLHSLDVSKHTSQVIGECDFVMIIPRKGVLCLEVKGCRSLSVENGTWYYGKRPVGDKRGPFKQAADNMHSIRVYLSSRNPDLGKLIFWSAVIFPFIPFKKTSLEWNDWQVIDRDSFNSRPVSQLFSNVLDQAEKLLSKKTGLKWFEKSSDAPKPELCQEILKILRPEFEFYQSPFHRRKKLSDNLKKYTSEQYTALDAMQTNPRVIFNGPAGTGKTILAIETARRMMIQKKRVLFLCFNKNISVWIKDQFEEEDLKYITVSTLHALMLKTADIKIEKGASSDFWTETLPSAAIEKLIRAEKAECWEYDYLVMDEAQDMLRENYIDFLDLLLQNGLKNGTWNFFGDFENQRIYSASKMDLDGFISRNCRNTSVYTLGINCRNTPRIAAYAHLLGGLDPDYKSVLRPDDNIRPELKFYESVEQQTQILSDLLEKIRSREKYKNHEIVILSPVADQCCARRIGSPWKQRLAPYSPVKTDSYISYCTVHAYKGLEAPVVIVTDIEEIRKGESINLLYISITRALSRLVILLNKTAQNDLKKILGV
ncbi:nuclease-related domain-containing DEAD/DEAH box helicase [Desulfobacula phenolica]|uniref:DNA 3'-5' helicase II n=1 Tax=Desulfobacula phenolica TaxID=90732 RepID=A0A1H2J1H4_9BACT|nr:NERD domain-containing protein [Desulfobacula phenolica]SDU50317.1 PhoH-like protein [Desulfobacula phenolica]